MQKINQKLLLFTILTLMIGSLFLSASGYTEVGNNPPQSADSPQISGGGGPNPNLVISDYTDPDPDGIVILTWSLIGDYTEIYVDGEVYDTVAGEIQQYELVLDDGTYMVYVVVWSGTNWYSSSPLNFSTSKLIPQ